MNDELTGQGTETVLESRRVETTVEVRQDAHGVTPAGEERRPGEEELTKVRELVLRAHPDVVPELVRGTSVDELIASVEPARSAYQQVADRVRAGQPPAITAQSEAPANTRDETAGPAGAGAGAAQPRPVPAGGAGGVVDAAALTAKGKIAVALAERRRN